MRVAALHAPQPNHFQHRRHATCSVSRIVVQTKAHIVDHIEMREECVLLKDHADAPLLRRRMQIWAGGQLAADLDLAGVEPLKPAIRRRVVVFRIR